ncbi:MAG: rod shape-determining protein [Clostridiales bacterium]|nr:rod shape-determining protein [Clostridiales bacterium]
MWGYQDVGIDLGTASVLVYVRDRGIVLREPSVVAIEKNTRKLLAVGEDARKMLGRTPGNIVAIRPLRDGVISDYTVTERMLRHVLNKVVGRRFFFRPRVVVCVPSGVTEVEKRSVREATLDAGARQTLLIEEPIAAAIGAGIDISRPYGSMVVDIGGGTTDIAAISLGGAVVSESIKIAGDRFDDAIIRYMRKQHNLLIGERTAEELKVNIGAVFPRKEVIYMEVTGRNLISGLPKTVTVGSDEMIEALEEPTQAILEAVHSVLERTPPEIAADIFDRGIVMTGGGSLLYGLDMRIQQHTRVPCFVADDAVSCVAIGTGRALEEVDLYAQKKLFYSRSSDGDYYA